MADNLYFTEAKDTVLRFIAKEYPTMPENLISMLINSFYKFCSYEEEGHDIKPRILFTSNIDLLSKNIPNFFKLHLFTDDDDRCKKCAMVEEELNNLGVTYYNFNVRASSYKDVLKRMNVDYEVRLPAIYVLDKGEISFNITNVQNKETVRNFIQNNDIISIVEKES